MDVWELNSDGRRQTMLSGACLVTGLVLAISMREYGESGSNMHAGFLLGAVLTLVGAASLAVSGSQRVVVDPRSRTIAIHDHRLVGHSMRRIAFSDIAQVQIAFLQTRSKTVLQYFLQLRLRSGEDYALFAPSRIYPGAADPAVVNGWKTRLEEILGMTGAASNAG